MISSVWVAVAAMRTWGRNSFTPLDRDQVGWVVAHGEDDECDAGIEAEPAPELDVEGIASDDVTTSGRVLRRDFRDSVDSHDHVAPPPNELVVGAGADSAHPEHDDPSVDGVDPGVVGLDGLAFEPAE